ncbi:mechanosensitive ion channel domain-containing protein [uncultured Alistipes sp.]|uniref:mechanosensitive ion channel family protein n=1 Tax=uncultured Alistipes sp. TaxID=538949 RepID=UPI0026084FC2|nr:mechanosensitive ion channel domain-containing protein [uncultured Alistipes sp.]
MTLTTLIAAAGAVADTTKKTEIADKLASLSQMSGEELIQMSIRGILSVGSRILIALVLLFVGRWIIKHLRKGLNRMLTNRKVEASLRSFLMSLTNITLTLFLIIVIIGILGIDTTSFIAVFASAGLAVGMALSGTLQNFAGGVMILIFKPFKVGDYIEAQGQSGTVKEIQLFNTVINTADNKTILIPNGGLSTGIINNYSKENSRRVDWTFGIGYGDDYDKAKATIAQLLESDGRIFKEPAYFIALTSLGDSSVNIVVRAWTASSDYWGVFFDMNEKVYKRFAEVGLNIPYPQMDVHLYRQEEK